MPRRVPSRFQQRSARPNRSWAGSVSSAPTVVPAASKVLLATFTLNNPGIDETALRTVGGIAVATDNLAGTEDQLGAFGLIVVTDLAAAAGVASIPGPVTDASDDGWFVYVPFAQEWNGATASGRAFTTQWYPFDSKAKRVVENGSTIALVVENAHATEGLNIYIALRLLSQVRGTR